MATENLLTTEDDWNDIFLAQDVDRNEDEQSADESDSDYDDARTATMIYSDSDKDEIEVGPAIELLAEELLELAASFLGVIAFFSSSFFLSLCKILIWLVVQALVLILARFLDHFEMREDKERASMEEGRQQYRELNKRRIKMRENIVHVLAWCDWCDMMGGSWNEMH